MIQITINGQADSVAECTSLASYLEAKGYRSEHIAVAVNQKIVKRNLHASTNLMEGDALIIIGAVKGG